MESAMRLNTGPTTNSAVRLENPKRSDNEILEAFGEMALKVQIPDRSLNGPSTNVISVRWAPTVTLRVVNDLLSPLKAISTEAV